jgi:hypothetical protein
MDVEKLPAAVAIGCLSVILVFPAFYAYGFIARLLGDCGYLGCGLERQYVAPVVRFAAAALLLRRAHIRRLLAQ